MDSSKISVRLDKYLWAIRMFKSRSMADNACKTGKVKMNGQALKSSREVVVGDLYEFKNEAGKKIIKVTGIIEKRVQFSEAVKFYEDHTPPEDKTNLLPSVFYDKTGKRGSKSGRPTKRNRRDLEDVLGISLNED